jgi:7-cyano-7-deazaguanine synthase in queuosine biosynthesis
MKYYVLFSGGVDSTTMLIKLIEENYPIDEIVFADTGFRISGYV